MRKALFTTVMFGMLFQAGHFVEHLVQALVWIFGNGAVAYMSPIAMNLTMHLGQFFYPGASCYRQHMMGMEILHLLGNMIFLFTLIGTYHLIRTRQSNLRILGDPTKKYMKWALGIETFHFYEHVMLVTTAHVFHVAIGASTLFGLASPQYSNVSLAFGVGFRVLWHFAMNAIPTYLMIKAITGARRPLAYVRVKYGSTSDYKAAHGRHYEG